MSAAAPPPLGATTLGSGLVLAAAAGALLLIPLALLMRRHARAFPLLAVLALPFRLPVSADGRTVNLLIPLYIVVAAGTLAHLLPRVLNTLTRGRHDHAARPAADPRRHQSSPAGGLTSGPPGVPSGLRGWRSDLGPRGLPSGLRGWRSRLRDLPTPRGLEWLLMASVALYALQALYSPDLAKAAENVAFFYVPFTLLFFLLRDVRWTRELLLACLAVAVLLAVVFAGIGFVEYSRKTLFLNPRIVAANQYDNYFRVNSLFFDPNIYGRFLALVMIALTVIVLWRPRRRDVIACAAVLAWLLGGLMTSFSQSSIAALLLGLAVLAAWRWELRATLYAAGLCLAMLFAMRRMLRIDLRPELGTIGVYVTKTACFALSVIFFVGVVVETGRLLVAL